MKYNVVQKMKAFGKYPEAILVSEDYEDLGEARKELNEMMATVRSKPSIWRVNGELLAYPEGYDLEYFDFVLLNSIGFEFYIEESE